MAWVPFPCPHSISDWTLDRNVESAAKQEGTKFLFPPPNELAIEHRMSPMPLAKRIAAFRQFPYPAFCGGRQRIRTESCQPTPRAPNDWPFNVAR
jgi:hypothetical protein